MDNFDFSRLVAAAIRIQNFWNREGISYCFIGGLAVQYWGEVRMTQDVDATVATGFGNEVAMIEKELRMLCDLKEEPEIVEQLLAMRDKVAKKPK